MDHAKLWRLNRPTCSALPSSVFSGKYVTEPVAWAVCHYGILDKGAKQKLRLRPPPCFGWCVIGFEGRCSVCVQAVDVCVYVCDAACYACFAVLQRRHNFDTFLRRFGKRQPQELVRHWIRTATRNSLSDDSLCGHVHVPWQCRSRLNSKRKVPKNGLQLLRGWQAPCGAKTSQCAAKCFPLRKTNLQQGYVVGPRNEWDEKHFPIIMRTTLVVTLVGVDGQSARTLV